MSKTLIALIAIAALLAVGCDRSEPEQPAGNAAADAVDASAATASPAPAAPLPLVDFTLTDMAGETRSSSEWEGQPRLVNFWATWCAPCRREIPLLKETQEKYGALNLQVIGIAVDFQEDVEAYAEEAQFNYPILVGQEDAMAVAESSGVDFIGLPFTMVVSPSGELIKTHIGEIVEEHIDAITDVFAQMERGELDVAGAREALGPI